MLADQQQELAKVRSHTPNLPLSMKCFPRLLCKGLAVVYACTMSKAWCY